MRRRLGLQRRLQLSVVLAVAIALAALITAFNFVLGDRLSQEANNALSARANGELASLRVQAGRLIAPEVPDAGALDAQTWVFAAGRVLEQPPSDPASARAVELLRGGPRRTRDVAATHTRLFAVPVIVGGGRLGTVVAAVSMRPYESTAQTALIASVALGAAVLLVVAGAAGWLIRGALRPVAQMTAQAEEWSEADTGRRFGLGPPRDELTHLAATLDQLLDRVAASLRHEQRFSAELSHELRSPLTSVIAEAQLALRHERSIAEHRHGYERLLESAQQMRRTIDTLVTAARVEAQGTRGAGDAAGAARAAAHGYERVAAAHGVAITVTDPPTPIRVGVDPDVAERVLAPLIENACRYGRRHVTVSITRRDGAVVFEVVDDGEGVVDADRDRIFEPGRPENGHRRSDGAGLGLPLARRLARAAGGDVRSESGGPGGRFVARLPAA
jgi:two-component system, OmpR family, sensor kinase